jgi:GDPmannose 4,6-dehydratase
MWRMLQLDEPVDLVVSTGQSWTVQEFLEKSFSVANLDWEEFVRFDSSYLRPAEVDSLIGDASLALQKINWSAQVGAERLAEIMVEHDMSTLSGYRSDRVESPMWAEETS